MRQREGSTARPRLFYVDKSWLSRLPGSYAERRSIYCRSALISRGNLSTSFWPNRWKQDARTLIPSNRSEEVIPHFQFTDVAGVDSGQLRYRKISKFSHQTPSDALERSMSGDQEDGFGGSATAPEIQKKAVDRGDINILVRLPVRYRPYTTSIPVEENTRAKTANHFNIGESFPVAIVYLAKPPIQDRRPLCTRGGQSDLCICACSSQRATKSSGWYSPRTPQCGPESPCLTFPFQDERRIGPATYPYRFRAVRKRISVSRENNVHNSADSIEELLYILIFFRSLSRELTFIFFYKFVNEEAYAYDAGGPHPL